MSAAKPPVPASIPARLHDLYLAAAHARANAYAPYSKYPVGAAIRTRDGKIFAGANFENAVNGASVCAERGAAQAAMSALGKLEPVEVFVITGSSPPAAPCGVCRQVLIEFVPSGQDLEVYAANPSGELITTRLSALFPAAYTPEFLKK